MKLYSNPASPFARKVIVGFWEVKAIDDVEVINVIGNPVDSGDIPITENPLGKLPTLVDTPFGTLYDSRVITRFIDHHYDGGLYPSSTLFETLKMEALADGILDAAVLMTYEKRVRSEDKQSEAWMAGQWIKINRSLDALESKGKEFLNSSFNIAHIALGSALDYLDFRHSDRAWRSGHPKLNEWSEQISHRPSMIATKPA